MRSQYINRIAFFSLMPAFVLAGAGQVFHSVGLVSDLAVLTVSVIGVLLAVAVAAGLLIRGPSAADLDPANAVEKQLVSNIASLCAAIVWLSQKTIFHALLLLGLVLACIYEDRFTWYSILFMASQASIILYLVRKK